MDRFGQRANTVRAVTLYGRDNQIDGIVLDVLLRKHEAIRKATGVSVPVPDNTDAVVEALMEGLLLRGRDPEQLGLELDIQEKQDALYTRWDSAAEREKVALTKYAQHGIKPEEVAEELRESREALGTNVEVYDFVQHALKSLRSTCTTTESGFTATLTPLPLGLRDSIPPNRKDPLQFNADLPVARGEAVLNRTDTTVEAIANFVLESALDSQLQPEHRPARRCAVVRTKAVSTRTTLLLVRYRFHLTLPARSGTRELVAEDLAALAFEGAPAQANWLEPAAAVTLLKATPSGNVPEAQAQTFLGRSLDNLDELRDHLEQHGESLAQRLLESHRRVRQASADIVRGLKVSVEPAADILGVFVFVPPAGGAQ